VLIATGHRAEKKNNTSPQESSVDVAFPEWGSLEDRGKDTMDGCREAFSSSLRIFSWLSSKRKVGSNSRVSDLQGAGVNNAGHGSMLVRQLDDTRVTPGMDI
jgi:hypothetical protein